MDKDLRIKLLFFKVNGNNIAPCIFQSHLHKSKFNAENNDKFNRKNWFKGKMLLTNIMLSVTLLIWTQQVYSRKFKQHKKKWQSYHVTQGRHKNT